MYWIQYLSSRVSYNEIEHDFILMEQRILFICTIVLKCAKYYFPLLFCDCHSYIEPIEPYVRLFLSHQIL